jgi:hypothetical protein
MKKLLGLFLAMVFFSGIAWGMGVENPLGPVDPGNSHNGDIWTMTLRGHEYAVDGDLNRFLKVPREYVFKVWVADMNGWIYFDSDICLHSWQLFAADESRTKFLWYGWMNGGFRTIDDRGFISGRVEFVAPGIEMEEAFPFVFVGEFFKKKKNGEVTEIRGTAISLGMTGHWPRYWAGDYDLIMKREQDDGPCDK